MAASKLNVLFLVVDDLRCELGCYGRGHVVSPHVDALAADGLLLERAYCQQTICAPSRASVLTGCRPDTTGILDLKTPVRSAMPDVRTLPEHFLRSGYETVSVGKVYHHADDDLQGWSSEPFRSAGDWKGRGYLTDEAIEAVERYNAQAAQRGWDRRGLGPAFEAADVPDDAYQDGKDAAAAVARLRHLAGLGRPFFLAVGFHKPHLPFNAPRRYWDLYDPQALPAAENPFPPRDVTPFSLTDFGELRGYTDMPEDGPVPAELARRLVHGYCACVSYVDAQVGRVLAELDRLRLRDRTAVVLWGDHGWKLGEHGSWCKHTNFEIDARAPLIVRAPGAAGGRRSEALVEFVDIYPTLCELCELPLPRHLEGRSLVPLLSDPQRPWKQAAFSQYPRGGVMGYAMRTGRYRYVEWRDGATGELKDRELYDHQSDPQENVNAASRPENAEAVRRLSQTLQESWPGPQRVTQPRWATRRADTRPRGQAGPATNRPR